MINNCSRLFVVVALGLTLVSSLGNPSHAGYVVNVMESGGNVVATGSGTINTTDLTFNGGGSFAGTQNFRPDLGVALFGPTDLVHVDLFLGISGPSSFGSGIGDFADSGTGDFVGVLGPQQLVVPANYVSNSQLSSSTFFSGSTFSSLGLTTGTYVWTWGSGANADSFTMNIVSSVPEPASLVMLGMGSLAILGYARSQKKG
jgi:hypothetical protein